MLFVAMHSDANASPVGEIIETIAKFFARSSDGAVEQIPKTSSPVTREISQATIQNDNQFISGLSVDYILSHMPEGHEVNQLKNKLKGNLDCPRPQEPEETFPTSERSLKNFISNIVDSQTLEEVKNVWEAVRAEKSPYLTKSENGRITGDVLVYLFGATKDCKGLVSIRVLYGKTDDATDKALARVFFSPPHQLMNDVCTPMRITWMKDYGYTTEDYVVNSQFNIISSNVIGYEQCVGEDLKNWREFMATK